MAIHELFAYLRMRDAAKAIEFYKQAFGATEKFRLCEPGGRVGHAELDFGGATLSIHLHVDNADEVIRRAVLAGGAIVRPATDQFYGERSGTVRDPFGHEWNVGHEIEKVTPEEMQRRYDATMKG